MVVGNCSRNFEDLIKRENPTGWRLWGLHRDGNIDRFLKPMLVV
jgi:hypothetical protein